MTLAQTLEQTVETVRGLVPARIFSAIGQSITDLRQTGLAGRATGVGARPELPSLPDRQGRPVDLAALAANRPVVLVFYRGGWCPYCNVSLRALQASLPDIRAAGAELVAVTPEAPGQIDATAGRAEADFPILHDAGNAFARSLGLVFHLPVALRPDFAEIGIDLPAHNGEPSFSLPIPATYVLAPGGRIAWAFIDADFTKRAEPSDVLAALRAVTDLTHTPETQRT